MKAKALLIGGLSFILLISIVYGYMQKSEAERMAAKAIECERISTEREEELYQRNEEISKLTEELRQQLKTAEENLAKAKAAAEAAAKFKK